jgi:hypothetical protein
MIITDYCSKRKETIEKAKVIKIVQRQTQTEIIRRSDISVIAPKVIDQWFTNLRFMSRGSINLEFTSLRFTNLWFTSQRFTSSGFNGSGFTSP